MQLAGHIGGITPEDDKDDNLFYPTVKEALGVFLDKPMVSAPGVAYNYATPNFTLLSAVIEQASGSTYLDYLRE
jgi:CubicO group peptidase (beta-lactamase class C family)